MHFIGIMDAGKVSPQMADVKYMEFSYRWNLRAAAKRGKHPKPKTYSTETFDLLTVCYLKTTFRVMRSSRQA